MSCSSLFYMGFAVYWISVLLYIYTAVMISIPSALSGSTKHNFICVWTRWFCVNLTVVCMSVSPVDIREIKEIRTGQKSRDFERYVEDSSVRLDQTYCFVILYGTEFRLKSLSLSGTHTQRTSYVHSNTASNF